MLLKCMSIKSTVEEAVAENAIEGQSERDIAAAFDRTWQKCGHSSLNGVVLVV